MTLATHARDLLRDVTICLSFFSRLPVRLYGPAGLPELRAALRVLPLAGLVLGLCGVLALAVSASLGFPPAIAATLTVAALVSAGGGLHEDGLADVADGFGGGGTRDRKLAIMRDSRIGTYGVLALGIALLLRVLCLTTLLEREGLAACAATLIGAGALSRALAILPLLSLPPARTDGLGRGLGRPDRAGALTCMVLGGLLGFAPPLLAGMSLGHALLGVVAAASGSMAVTSLAQRQIGGHTGDVGGASQQAAEIGYLLGLLASP